MAFLIRDFVPDDQPDVAGLIQEGMRQRWGSRFDPSANPDSDDLWASYVDAGGELLVGELDGAIVATGTLIGWGPEDGRVLRMSVAQAHQGVGLGRELLAELVTRAARRGMGVLHVSTDVPWADAVAFYESCGFLRVGESDGDIHLEHLL